MLVVSGLGSGRGAQTSSRPTGTRLRRHTVHVFRACLRAPGGAGAGAGAQWAAPCVPRLAPLHRLLQPMASCARVVQCAEAVPTLLQLFFSAVTQVSPPLVPHSQGFTRPGRGPSWSKGQGLARDLATALAEHQ